MSEQNKDGLCENQLERLTLRRVSHSSLPLPLRQVTRKAFVANPDFCLRGMGPSCFCGISLLNAAVA